MLALQALKERHMSISRAARLFQINKRTLYDHYKGKYKDCPKRFKNKGTVLTQQEEQALVEYLRDKTNAGYAIRKIDLKKAFLVCLISRWSLIWNHFNRFIIFRL